MKKVWRPGSTTENCVESGELGKSQLGQLLTYLVGHSVQQCSKIRNRFKCQPMLGIYVEGSKVRFYFAVTIMLYYFSWNPRRMHKDYGTCFVMHCATEIDASFYG